MIPGNHQQVMKVKYDSVLKRHKFTLPFRLGPESPSLIFSRGGSFTNKGVKGETFTEEGSLSMPHVLEWEPGNEW